MDAVAAILLPAAPLKWDAPERTPSRPADRDIPVNANARTSMSAQFGEHIPTPSGPNPSET